MIQPTLDIYDSPFTSSYLLTLYLLLLPSSTPMNISILYYPIFSIPYISQMPSTSPIADKFQMYTWRNISVVAIDNKEPDIDTTAIQILWDKKNLLDPPPSISTFPYNILTLSPPTKNTASSLTKVFPSYNHPSNITESSPQPLLWKLLIFARPSREPARSTG